MQRYAPTPRQMLWGVLGALVLMVLFVGIGYAVTTIPNPNSVATRQSTLLYYSDGKTLIARLGDTNRVNVPLDQVPLNVQRAVLSAEDRSFESEPGISPTGILRALIVNIKGGDVQQGGSTITQQYVKNAYLSQQRTFTRKFKEIFIAVKLGNTRPKSEILQDYLNTIYFGRNAYGIEAASKAYFQKDVSKLDVSEGAVLAAIIRAPTLYDPIAHPDAAKARWHYVIDGMVKQHWLTAEQAGKLSFPAVFDPRKHPAQARQGDCTGYRFFICQAVKAELDKDGFGEERLAAGGYRVITTLDKKAQFAARDSVLAHNGNFVTSGADKGRESAVVSVQPGDGAIRAMWGGGDGCSTPNRPDDCTDLTGVTGRFGGGDFKRSPGSSFKPYTLIAALQQGISLDSGFPGPAHIDFPGTNGKGISNSEGESCGYCTLTQALAKSINTIFVPLAQKVGPDKVAQAAKDAGIPAKRIAPTDEVPAITLGTSDVAPIDQAVGYATIAAQGVRAQPYIVGSIKTLSGHTVYKAKRHTTRVFPADVMADTTYAMTQVLVNGTAAGDGLPGRPAAGKTGTNGEIGGNHDAWFVGFTPQLSTAVWYGNYNAQKFVTDNGGPMYGGGKPASTWQQMMTAALLGKPVLQFPPPAHVGQPLNPPTPTNTPSSPSPTTSPSPSASSSAPPTPTAPPVTPPQPTGTSTGAAPPPSSAPPG